MAVPVTGGVFASPAQGVCYFPGGGCGYGLLIDGLYTPWTGAYYHSTPPYVGVSSLPSILEHQVRHVGNNAYTHSGYPYASYYLQWPSFNAGSWQHRCRHYNPQGTNRSAQCGW